jgi:hypothetical protein
MARTTYEEIRIGPFVGGLNTLSSQSSIDDLELHQMINFENDRDGSLVSRPPIFTTEFVLGGSGGQTLLGYYVEASTGNRYLIASNSNQDATYYLSGTTWNVITTDFAASAVIQFRDELWILAPHDRPEGTSGTWSPGGAFAPVAGMPSGSAIVANKERLWIAPGKDAETNGSRVWVSDLSAGAIVWDGDFFNVSQGDGQNVVDLAIVYNDLVIFKQRSTYRFSYGADVSTGQVSRISDSIGVTDVHCWASYENQLFVLFDDNVYEFTNYIYTRINYTIPLEGFRPAIDFEHTHCLSIWADRVIVAFYGQTMVYNLMTRTWCEWRRCLPEFGFDIDNPLPIGRVLQIPGDTNPDSAYMDTGLANSLTDSAFLGQINNELITQESDDYHLSELMQCVAETKAYDYQSPAIWKRLRFWAADVEIKGSIDVLAQPVLFGSQITWGKMDDETWDFYSDSPWGNLLGTTGVEADSVSVAGLGEGRKFIKFLKSLRFRQISFRIEAETRGTIATAPVRIFSLVTYAKEKALVTPKIS